jgi:Tfp pilus assembly protein PilF
MNDRSLFSFFVFMVLATSSIGQSSIHDQATALCTTGVKQFLADNVVAKAKEIFGAALAIDPSCAQAHYNLGMLAEAEKDWSAANSHFSRYLELAPLSRLIAPGLKPSRSD